MFNVSETLLRFWEKQFPQIKPRKSGRNIRQYSRDDIEQVRLIYNLVKVRGLKLAAARDALNKNHSGEQQTTEVIEKLKNIRIIAGIRFSMVPSPPICSIMGVSSHTA